MNPLTSFFRLLKWAIIARFDFKKTKIIDIIEAENEEEADKIFRLIGNNLRVDRESLRHWNEPDPHAGEGEDY